jgi:hypothetical protein
VFTELTDDADDGITPAPWASCSRISSLGATTHPALLDARAKKPGRAALVRSAGAVAAVAAAALVLVSPLVGSSAGEAVAPAQGSSSASIEKASRAAAPIAATGTRRAPDVPDATAQLANGHTDTDVHRKVPRPAEVTVAGVPVTQWGAGAAPEPKRTVAWSSRKAARSPAAPSPPEKRSPALPRWDPLGRRK